MLKTLDQQVYDALAMLTPYDIDVPKVRIGPKRDGGYVLADILDPKTQIVISYGISHEYGFDRDMAERGHQVFMFDHTIDGIEDAHPNMLFFREGLAGRFLGEVEDGFTDETDVTAPVYRLADHLAKHDISSSGLVLKMDIESHEWGALAGADHATLGRFDQIVAELHSFETLEESDLYRKVFIKAMSNLNEQFTLFHVHANNVDGPEKYHFVSGMPVSCLIEASFVRTDIVNRRPSGTLYPTHIDFPNFGERDRLLWMHPFIPSGVDQPDYHASLNAANRRA